MNSDFFDMGLTFVQPVDFAHARPALVVIDMQYSDAAEGRGLCLALERIQPGCCDYFNSRNEGQTVPGIQYLVEGFRERSLPIVYLCLGSQYQDLRDMPARQRAWIRAVEAKADMPDLFWAQNPDYAIRSEFAPRPDDTVIHKTTFGAFNSSNIDLTLSSMGIDTLIVTGISTNACVETTARDAADRGYACVLVDDCTTDYDDAAQQATMRGFYFNFGRVIRTKEEVLAAIDQGLTI